jgi:hypothetical protein
MSCTFTASTMSHFTNVFQGSKNKDLTLFLTKQQATDSVSLESGETAHGPKSALLKPRQPLLCSAE